MSVICDTHALIWWALQPQLLSKRARQTMHDAQQHNELLFCDISYWEVAMLIKRQRLQPGVSCAEFFDLTTQACGKPALSITAAIAELAQDDRFAHGDPVDRIIAATVLFYDATLVTKAKKLHQVKNLHCVW